MTFTTEVTLADLIVLAVNSFALIYAIRTGCKIKNK